MEVIKTINLTKKFSTVIAVDSLNLEISEGEIFAFLGPNGAGKTTTVKLLSGLLRPTSGKAIICGYDVQKEPLKVKKLIGLVPDRPFLYPKLTGVEFLQFIGHIYDIPIEVQRNKIHELLTLFDLKDYANDIIENYSLGMKQKLVLAGILLHQPKVLFLDEPLVGLDPKTARLVKDIFLQLSSRGVAIFLCTHILEIAEKLAHRIGIIDKGKIIALGKKDDLRELSHKEGTLEDIYLDLTGATEYANLLKYL